MHRPSSGLHGLSAHGRRFRRLAGERLASRVWMLAPDLRGHGRSGHDPPWDLPTHLADVLETLADFGFESGPWIGHSFGGCLLLELCDSQPERVDAAVLLDPAIQILPHVGLDFAREAAKDRSFDSEEEAIEARLAGATPTPREFVAEEAREHLVVSPDGRMRWRYFRPAVVTAYSELRMDPPPPGVLGVPALLVHAGQFGLVRKDQLEEFEAELGDELEVVEVFGRSRRLLGRVRADGCLGREVPVSTCVRITRVTLSRLG